MSQYSSLVRPVSRFYLKYFIKLITFIRFASLHEAIYPCCALFAKLSGNVASSGQGPLASLTLDFGCPMPDIVLMPPACTLCCGVLSSLKYHYICPRYLFCLYIWVIIWARGTLRVAVLAECVARSLQPCMWVGG